MASNVVVDVVNQLREFGENAARLAGRADSGHRAGHGGNDRGLTSTAGALISDVPPGPAAEAGLMAAT